MHGKKQTPGKESVCMFVGECMCICLHRISLEVKLQINHHLRCSEG